MARRSRSVTVYSPPVQRAAPITIRMPRAPSAPRGRKRGGRRRGRSSSSGTGGIMAHALGGAAVGFLEKQEFFDKVPSFGFGRKGSITLVAYIWSRNGGPKLAGDVAKAGAVLCGYQFGKEGKISGDDGGDDF